MRHTGTRTRTGDWDALLRPSSLWISFIFHWISHRNFGGLDCISKLPGEWLIIIWDIKQTWNCWKYLESFIMKGYENRHSDIHIPTKFAWDQIYFISSSQDLRANLYRKIRNLKLLKYMSFYIYIDKVETKVRFPFYYLFLLLCVTSDRQHLMK